jgi:hypothetical protein
MKIVDNENLYQRNIRLAFGANLGAALLLIAAVLVLFNSPEDLTRYLAFLFGGIILMQVGLSFGRWGKRADLALNRALKSLDNNYLIFHQRSPVQHLLLGPSGIWILLPKHTQGVVSYSKEKQAWKANGGNLFVRVWRRLTQEKIGRPHFEAMIEAGALDRFLQEQWVSEKGLHVQAAVVFLDKDTVVFAGEAPFPAVSIKKLRNTVLNGEAKGKLNKSEIKKLEKLFRH